LASTSHANRLRPFLLVRFAKEVVCSASVHRFGDVEVLLHNALLMDEQHRNSNEKSAGETGRTAKKQYQEPGFRHERVFETMALSCGKVQVTILQCRFNRHTS
jgi:hypothetical protein